MIHLLAMERASRLMGKLTSRGGPVDLDTIVRTAWPLAVGKIITAHTRADHLVRTRLIVEVEDKLWQQNLLGMTRQILARLEQYVGPGLVDDVEFRVAPRRREPQRARASQPALAATDDAEGITDPVMRHIYRSSRRAQA
jgi:predicted nucleic acid-binding Zn ribbon protein